MPPLRALRLLLWVTLAAGVAGAPAAVPQMPRFRIVDAAAGLPSSAI
ncbi:hypothetical protein HF319_11450, partial [Xanthomonas sp. Kuri4-1]